MVKQTVAGGEGGDTRSSAVLPLRPVLPQGERVSGRCVNTISRVLPRADMAERKRNPG